MSIRLHSQLDTVEKKRSRLEQENEELRVRLQDLEVAKQVLQQEIDKVGSQYHYCAVWSRVRRSNAGIIVCFFVFFLAWVLCYFYFWL